MIPINQFGKITECQACAGKDLAAVLELGDHATVHGHISKEDVGLPQAKYPLNLHRCRDCGLMQLDYIVDPSVSFAPEYPYHTGMTNMLVNNFRDLRDLILEKYHLGAGDLVVDIGSNDGTLLQGFKEKGVRVLGVEPTNVAKVAQTAGIPTLQEFFSGETVAKIIKEHGPAKVVTATNVFAHIPNAPALARNIRELLIDDGIFVSESQYFLDTVEKTAFDMIYDEHLRYYSLKPMVSLLEKAGMSVIDAERIGAAGGSIRVYAAKSPLGASERVKQLIEAEDKAGLYDEKTLAEFAERAYGVRDKLANLIRDCKEKGRVVGIGAPGRSNTLLQFAGLDSQLIDYACEKKGSPKIGLFTPGTHIPIVDEEILFNEQPEYGLLLSWHIGDELMNKLRQLGYQGQFIMPLPEPRLVNEI